MKNWQLMTQESQLDISQEELGRLTPVLDGLEAAFRPLTAKIPLETEPAVVFQPLPKEPQ